MRRVALLAVVMTMGVAAPASAWVVLPPRPVPHDGIADCLRSAGAGQVTLLGRLSRTDATTDLLSVGTGGISPAGSTTLGWLLACPEVAVAAGTPPLLAAPVAHGPRTTESLLRVADGAGPPATVWRQPLFEAAPGVAIAPGGAAIVAWLGIAARRSSFSEHLYAAVRTAAGKPFGAPVRLDGPSGTDAQPAVAIDAAGQATVAWIDGGSFDGGGLLRVAGSDAAGHLAAQPAIASAPGDSVALAVAPGGRTLLVNYGGLGAPTAYERAAGAAAFSPVPLPISGGDKLALALADDGSAIVAVHSDPGPTSVTLRRPGGAFGQAQTLEPSPADGASFSSGYAFGYSARPAPPRDEAGAAVAATLDGAGHVLVTWIEPGDRGGADSAHVAAGTIAGGMDRPARLGSPCRAANAARPLTLPDGALGVAWTDNARVDTRDVGDETPHGGGQLHAALAGSAPPPSRAPSPGISARLIGPLGLHGGQPLRLRVRCSRGSCIVRAAAAAYSLNSSFGDTSLVARSIELPGGHARTLTLSPSEGETFARAGASPARISLLACSTAGTGVTRGALHLRLRRLPLLPVPRILRLAAKRHGRTIVVTWRTSIPARGATFEVFARPNRPLHALYAEVEGRGRSRFSVTLHEPRGTRERLIEVDVGTAEQPNAGSVSARIR